MNKIKSIIVKDYTHNLGEVIKELRSGSIDIDDYFCKCISKKRKANRLYLKDILCLVSSSKLFVLWIKKYGISEKVCIDGYKFSQSGYTPKSNKNITYYNFREISKRIVVHLYQKQFDYIDSYFYNHFNMNRLSNLFGTEIIRNFKEGFGVFYRNDRNAECERWAMYYWVKAKFALINLEEKIKEKENGKSSGQSWKKRRVGRSKFCEYH